VARAGFRTRLLIILGLFAAIPAIAVSGAWSVASRSVVQLLGGGAAWDSVAVSGNTAIDAVRAAPLTPDQRAAVDTLEQRLSTSAGMARRVRFLVEHGTPLVVVAGLGGLLVIAFIAWRVAGHLARQLSRPLDELVGWTESIARGEALPVTSDARGAPEFEVLRARMRTMAEQIEAGRSRAIEAERLRAFRESSRRFAHELKNPLTPIRFALTRLRRDAAPELQETIGVLTTEASRLEAMARNFAQFGRLPEGPVADVDIGEMVRYTARATVPERLHLTLDVADVPPVRGHHDVLSRALANVLLNAVDACGETGEIAVTVRPADVRGDSGVRIGVRDTGCGISPERIATIWEPYVTDKPGGTGLGLAIARQAINAHGGTVFATSQPGATEVGFVLPVNAGLPAITGEWNATAR
jgi:signal transduction histidine kinase